MECFNKQLLIYQSLVYRVDELYVPGYCKKSYKKPAPCIANCHIYSGEPFVKSLHLTEINDIH